MVAVQTKKVKTATGTNDQITDQIVREMWRLIRRDARNPKVISIAKSLKRERRYETLKSVFNYVRSNFPYKSDPPGIEHLTAPIHTLEGNAPYMDCDELVMVTSALLSAINVPVLIKTIAWRKWEYTHVVLEAEVERLKWMVIDATRADGLGNQERNIIREKRYK